MAGFRRDSLEVMEDDLRGSKKAMRALTVCGLELIDTQVLHNADENLPIST